MNVVAKKKVKGHVLKDLGYELSENVISLGSSPSKYGILEVREIAKPRREVSFCYLYSIRHEAGVILPRPFSFYKSQKVLNLETLLIENDLE